VTVRIYRGQMNRPPARTLLEQLVRESRLTLEENCAAFERTAREHAENATLSPRQLSRWMAGSTTSARPVMQRVAQLHWHRPFDRLVERPQSRQQIATARATRDEATDPNGARTSHGQPSDQGHQPPTQLSAHETRPLPEYEGLEPLDEVGHRLWRLGRASAEAALHTLQLSVNEIVDLYETHGPARLAPTSVRLRRRLDAMLSDQRDSAYRRQLLALAGQASGLLSYMSVNLGQFAYAEAYGLEAFALAREAGDRGLMAWVRGTQSFASYYRKDYSTAAALADDGLTHANGGPQSIRLLINGLARALAYLPGRGYDARRAVEAAYSACDRFDVRDGISPCISMAAYSSGRVLANSITVQLTIGDYEAVLRLVRQIAPTVHESDSSWSRALVGLDHASALLAKPARDVDQAMQVADAAVRVAANSPVTSVVQRADALAAAMSRETREPAVQEFAARLRHLKVLGLGKV
jgi:hypothetical protein